MLFVKVDSMPDPDFSHVTKYLALDMEEAKGFVFLYGEHIGPDTFSDFTFPKRFQPPEHKGEEYWEVEINYTKFFITTDSLEVFKEALIPKAVLLEKNFSSLPVPFDDLDKTEYWGHLYRRKNNYFLVYYPENDSSPFEVINSFETVEEKGETILLKAYDEHSPKVKQVLVFKEDIDKIGEITR